MALLVSLYCILDLWLLTFMKTIHNFRYLHRDFRVEIGATIYRHLLSPIGLTVISKSSSAVDTMRFDRIICMLKVTNPVDAGDSLDVYLGFVSFIDSICHQLITNLSHRMFSHLKFCNTAFVYLKRSFGWCNWLNFQSQENDSVVNVLFESIFIWF